jgi:hypothetical protein
VARKVDEPNGGGLGLEPETVLPSQFFDRFKIDASLQPEKRLMLAVLEDAVGTFQKYAGATSRRSRRLHAEAEEWFADRTSLGRSPFGTSARRSGSSRSGSAAGWSAGGSIRLRRRYGEGAPLPVPSRERSAALDHGASGRSPQVGVGIDSRGSAFTV